MQRRDFLHDCGRACFWLLAAPIVIGVEGCSAWPVVSAEDGPAVVRVPLSSLRGGSGAIVRSSALRDDLFLQRDVHDEWHALVLRCTHRDQPLSVHAGGISCAAHGSRFDLDGRVIAGPATTDLVRLPVTATPEALLIDPRRIPSS